jgi:hypothetical protein
LESLIFAVVMALLVCVVTPLLVAAMSLKYSRTRPSAVLVLLAVAAQFLAPVIGYYVAPPGEGRTDGAFMPLGSAWNATLFAIIGYVLAVLVTWLLAAPLLIRRSLTRKRGKTGSGPVVPY